MGMARNVGMGLVGGATTMLVRRAAKSAMHDRVGRPKLPRNARRRRGFAPMLAWAAAAGVIFAMADVLQEQRKVTGAASSAG